MGSTCRASRLPVVEAHAREYGEAGTRYAWQSAVSLCRTCYPLRSSRSPFTACTIRVRARTLRVERRADGCCRSQLM